MDELLTQLAKTLKIPTNALQQAVNHYPELRQQFVVYKSLTYVENAFDIIGLVATIVFVCAWFNRHDIDVDEKTNKKTRRLSIIIAAAAITIATIIHVVTVVATPDIQVIMEVINK